MRNPKKALGKLLGVRPGEGVATVLLFTHSVFIGITLTFLETASYALFLTEFDAKILPYAYIIAAVFSTLSGYIHTRIEEHVSFSGLLSGTLMVVLAAIIALYISLQVSGSEWVVMILSVSYYVLTVLAYLEFWALTGRMFNLRQGKRLYSLIGAGETVGGIIAGFSGSMLINMNFGTVNLLLLSASGMIVCLILLKYILRIFNEHLSSVEEEEEKDKDERSLKELFKDPYLKLVFMMAAFSIFAYLTLDYIFYNQVKAAYPDENEMASFVGTFLGVLRTVTLIFNAFLAGRLINKYGLSIGTLIFPGILTAGMCIAVASFFGMNDIFFWCVVGVKIIDEVIRYTIEEPSIRVFYQPLTAGLRMRAQTIVETMIEPVSSAVIGILLVMLTSVMFSFKAIHLAYAMFGILAGWMLISYYLLREYATVLKRRLERGQGIEDITIDPNVLINWLQRPKPGDVVYALNTLEKIGYDRLEVFMTNSVRHSEPQVRRYALERIGILGMSGSLKAVNERLELEKVPEVLGTALQTLGALCEADAFDQIFKYVKDEDREIRKGAMIGLLRYTGIDGVLGAGGHLNSLLDSEDPQERVLAAEVLGKVGISGFYRPLQKLLEDKEQSVRKAAIIASGNLKNPRLLPLLLKNLSDPAVRKEAIAAVVSFGEDILPELEAAFDQEDQSRHVRIRIIRAMGRIKGEKTVEILKKKMDFAEVDIRHHILAALVVCKHRESNKDAVKEKIWKEIKDATWALAALQDIGEDDNTRLIAGALKYEIEKNRKRIFLMLALIYSASEILNAQTNLGSSSAEKRSYALESLQVRVSMDIQTALFPLLEELTPAQRLSQLSKFREDEPASRHDRLKQILGRSQRWISSWTKACAVFTIGKVGTMEFYDTVISALSDADSVVRETAVWALGCLNPNDLPERLQPLTQDKSKRVADYTRFVINSVGFASIPMSRGYLTRSGRYTAELFKNILLDNGERRARRCRAANILSRFKGIAARSALMEAALTISDKTVRTAALDALLKGKFEIEGNERNNLFTLLQKEIDDAKQVLSSIVILVAEQHSERLVQALNQEINNSRRRALSILAVLGGKSRSLDAIFYWYIHQQGSAIPDSVTAKLKTLLLQVHEEKLRKRLFTLFHQYRGNSSNVVMKISSRAKIRNSREVVEAHLKEIAFGSSVFSLSWSRICALEMIVKLSLSGCVPHLVEKLEDLDDIVRATAAWALFKLDRKTYTNFAKRLENDISPLVSQTAEQLRIDN
jgi:HEAT repeat protein/ATP/ADP translocase